MYQDVSGRIGAYQDISGRFVPFSIKIKQGTLKPSRILIYLGVWVQDFLETVISRDATVHNDQNLWKYDFLCVAGETHKGHLIVV